MKLVIPAMSLLCLSAVASPSAWAVCSTNVVDVNLLTTVTVTAGPRETCVWQDNNPNNSRTLSIAGVAVPAPLSSTSATFEAASFSVPVSTTVGDVAACGFSNFLACSAGPSTFPAGGTAIKRICKSENDSNALSATATCVFEGISNQ